MKVNYKALKEQLIAWFRFEMERGGGKYAVIGISGGKDSTIAAAIAAEALGPDHVIGLMLPNGEQKDISDAMKVCEILGIRHQEININPLYDHILRVIARSPVFNSVVEVEHGGQLNVTELNTPPRIRMTVLRAMANAIPGGRFINTSNMSEFFMGYFTKDGDSCGDIFPLLALSKTEIVEVGKLFKNIPEDLIIKAPADGLTGKTDEEVLGVDYESVDDYMALLESKENIDDRAYLLVKELYPIQKRHAAAAHKLTKTPIFFMNKDRENFFRSIR